MLRRKFIKGAVIVGSGIMVSSRMVFGDPGIIKKTASIKKRNRRVYALHGSARSGCATPPESLGYIEGGLNCHPF